MSRIIAIESVKPGDVINYVGSNGLVLSPKWIVLSVPAVSRSYNGAEYATIFLAGFTSLQCFQHMCQLPQLVEIQDD